MTTKPRTLIALGSFGAVVLAGGAALFACEGPEGPPGATVFVEGGTLGQPGPAGPDGPPGPSGLATLDGGTSLTTSCMMPCHGFKGIVDQWKTSTHYFGAIANTDEVPTWTGPGPCGNCHSGDGLEQRLASNVGVAAGFSAPTGLTSGEINYKKGAGVGEINYAGSSKVAIISCITCHDISATNDPHVTGQNYVAGQFKLRVKSGPDDQMLIEKSPVAGTVNGTPAGKWGVSNTCIACHKSRKDVTNYITASNPITSTHWGPHEAPQAEIFSGKGGYHYAGKTFSNSTHQSLAGCASCHMVDAADNGGFPDHSMRPTIKTCAAAGCHANVTSFDVAGGQGVVKAALGELQGLLASQGLLTRSATAPYVALAAGDPALSDQRFNLDLTMPGNVITDIQAGALYNYLLIAKGSGLGVHNPIYTKELLFDSIEKLKPGNLPPNAIPTRP